MEDNLMFRYLEKYVGTYRVKAHFDPVAKDFPRDEFGEIDESFDDLFIPCSRGQSEIRHTYDPGMLVWYTPRIKTGVQVLREVASKRSKMWYKPEETDGEVMIYFRVEDLSDIAKTVNPTTSGASIPPYSDKNLPGPVYTIPDKDKKALKKILDTMEPVMRTNMLRTYISNFDKNIKQTKGRRFNIEAERETLHLKPLVYIHYVGMWKEFMSYVKKEVKDSHI